MGQPVLSEFTRVGVHLLKKVRPLLALFEVHGTECSLRHGQAETDPDILRMLQNQVPAMHKASANHSSPGAVKREFRSASPMTEQNQNAAKS